MPAGSRKWRGCVLERRRLHGLEQALCCACDSRAASTISSSSAGLSAPSLFSRARSRSSPLDPVDLDAGGLGEVVVQRLVGLVVARRIKVQDRVLGSEGRRRGKRGQERDGAEA